MPKDRRTRKSNEQNLSPLTQLGMGAILKALDGKSEEFRTLFGVSRNFDIGTRVAGMSHNFEGEVWELEFDNGYILHVCADGTWRIVKGEE